MVIQSPPRDTGPSASPSANGTGVPTAGQVAGRRWRSARGVVGVFLALIVIAVVLAALRPSGSPEGLDPTSPKQDGTRALAEILKQRGTSLTVARRAGRAADASTAGSVLVVTRTERLTSDDLDRLRGARGDLLLVRPSRDVLEALAPGVRASGPSFARTSAPDCALQAATLAGRVSFGQSQTYEASGNATGCYKAGDFPRLVQTQSAGRTVTVVGSAGFLTNEHLAEEGNAALAMNLVGARSSAVWLIPDLPPPGSDTGDKTIVDLVPFGVWLFFLELLVTVLLVALWRGRRLGPVVAEALPVVVRSAETVEGRSRLYRASRARDRAADALRSGARDRMVPLLGLPRASAQDLAAAQEIVAAVAVRTGWNEAVVGSALYGPEPADDAGLIALANVLDDLERQVRQS
ncbi:DUF4350 domain-containing protein [Actinomadura rubrisoli]|uniref:DUF4350 domain-containing protein n=1 Tax=Actinomadura rubrisoli TaxID=2530368 RepID=A0A4R5ALP1_9ACTN|nr:DUF4350 domain-containing protein [Actinomadura rubrisoli]TDD72550.1 DUF4350 domain-containing protein [Actinomadura rubrisoli]